MKSILITGAASGIGRATALRFHREGWLLGLLDVNEAALSALASELGERTWYRALDVTDHDATQRAVREFADDHGGLLHVLFNSAGVLYMGRFEDVTPAQHRLTFDVNIHGLVNVIHAAFPWLRDTDGARVINMSSASALYGIPHLATYSASKFAVRGLTEALNIEWRRHGITVVDLMPPFVNTGMVNDQAFRAPVVDRMGVNLEADDVAEAVWRATKNDDVHQPISLPFQLAVLIEKLSPGRLTRGIIGWLSRD